MKKKHINPLAVALRSVSIHGLDEKDGYAIINNIIALTDEVEEIEKKQKEALDKFKPPGYERMEGDEKRDANESINEKFSNYISPFLDQDSALSLETISKKSIDEIIKQKDVATGSKAMIMKFLGKKGKA